MRHVLSISEFTRKDMEALFAQADALRARVEAGEVLETYKGRVLTLLFQEPSTRTRCSFQAAMLRLAGRVMVVDNTETSSIKKGESLEDTVRCLSSYSDAIVLRHPAAGSAARAAAVSECPVINAGDGDGEHPTQALLDLYSIARELGRRRGLGMHACASVLDGVHVCVVGDLRYGRTVHSLVQALACFEGVHVWCCPVTGLELPAAVVDAVRGRVTLHSAEPADVAIAAAHVLYVTRVQRERLPADLQGEDMESVYPPVSPAWLDAHGAREDVLVLHPLPRVHELSRELDKDPRAGYWAQMRHGMYLRMALLCHVLGLNVDSHDANGGRDVGTGETANHR